MLMIGRHQIENNAPPNDVIERERPVMSKGRLLKVRFSGHPVPNVHWVWWPAGNCGACRYHVPSGAAPGVRDHCANRAISPMQFSRNVERNDCPEYEAGMPDWAAMPNDHADALRAAGMIPGEPSQMVEVLQNLPWSPDAARIAGAQQAIFLQFASIANAAARAGWTPGTHYEHNDLSDDLSSHDPVASPPAA